MLNNTVYTTKREIGVTFYSSLENMKLWLFGDETNYSVV